MNTLYRALALIRDAQALSRGPAPFARRYVRRKAHRGLARALRDVGLTEHGRRR